MDDVKCIVNVIYLLILISYISSKHGGKCSCIYDEIKLEAPQKIMVRYEKDAENVAGVRSKRSESQQDHASSSLYQPIRISIEYSDIDYELNGPEQEDLKQLVENMVRKVTNIFSVIPVQGNLLLRRKYDGCSTEWTNGPNIGKCARAKKGYDKEICINGFQIPDKHLAGVSLWNRTHPDPVKVLIEDGEGLPNTDYVLYVRSRTDDLCVSAGYNVIAYASYCQVDQHNRPIAGLITFCPKLLKDDQKEIDEVTALHEMFHALGFSSHLFEKFQECTPTGNASVSCSTRHRPVKFIGGVPRLVTPKLVAVTSAHFNCSTHGLVNDFGPILQIQDGKYKSHWDPAFMQTSLMAPTIGLPHLTFIDEITLALFEDSGWYKVNYNYAEKFLWGKDGGCDFGMLPACEKDSAYFCTGEAKKCHYLHKDKATCKTNLFLHGCRIYQAKDLEDSCQNLPTDNSSSMVYDEYYGEDSRCFVANITKVTVGTETSTEMSGRCYQHRCNSSDHVTVRVGQSPWLSCPSGQHIQVPGYNGELECPDASVVCGTPTRRQSTTATPPTVAARATLSSHKPTQDSGRRLDTVDTVPTDRRKVCIEVTFSTQDNPALESEKTVIFHSALVSAVIRLSGVSHRRLDDAQVVNSGSIVYYIEVKPQYNASDGPTNREVVKLLESAVHSHMLSVSLAPDGDTFVASSVRHSFGKCEVKSHKRYTGIIIGAALGSLATIAVIGVLVGLLIVLLRHRYNAQKPSGSQSIDDVVSENRL